MHGGGVVATFCDGHTAFLSEGIAYDVYIRLMTPDGNKIRTQFPEAAGPITDADLE